MNLLFKVGGLSDMEGEGDGYEGRIKSDELSCLPVSGGQSLWRRHAGRFCFFFHLSAVHILWKAWSNGKKKG